MPSRRDTPESAWQKHYEVVLICGSIDSRENSYPLTTQSSILTAPSTLESPDINGTLVQYRLMSLSRASLDAQPKSVR